MNKDKLNSIHIFIFPFRWRFRNGSSFSVIEDKLALNKISKNINSDFWEKIEFSHKICRDFQTYNEYAYFYPQVRDILSIKDPEEERMLNVLQYQYRILRELQPQYKILLKEGKEYRLDIENITLNLYPHGVGIFVFHLQNYRYRNKIDILKINDYGRRIFPQYLGIGEDYVSAPKNSFLADKIGLYNINTEFGNIVEEDFSYYNNHNNLNKQSFRLPAFIGKLLGKAFYAEGSKETQIRLTPVLDDRMFVVSYYNNSQWMNELKEWDEDKKTYYYKSDKIWYQYIFVDGKELSVKNKELLAKQLEEHTYARWLESGQLFGICRYAFVVLVGDNWFNRNVISKHVTHMYLQLVILNLLQRAYLLVFDGEVARLANALQTPKNIDKTKKIISNLYLNYIKFINRIYFSEVTAQEQGIELYDMLQDSMGIKKYMNDLDREISKLNEYMEHYEESKLTRLAALYLPVSLLAGLLGMNTINESYQWTESFRDINWPITLLVILTIFAFIWSLWVVTKHFFKKL